MVVSNKVVAVYCRQSVEKVDSISIETQIEKCKCRIAQNEKFEIYQDKGYSGSNTNRPEFQRLMQDIDSGKISKVVVYKIDRISRSLVDFSNIVQKFDNKGVDFASATEEISFSGAMNRAMLNIIMVFAQLERETIQARVTDNFYERAKHGYFLAGKAPFGFNKKPTKIGNINTHILEENPTESVVVRYVYNEYLNGKSIGSIIRELNDTSNEYNLGRKYTSVFIGRMLRNPVYVQSNADVYNYFKSKNAILHNGIEEFKGNGCTVYGNRKNKTQGKFNDLSGENIQLNLHKGLIEPDKWLIVQRMLSENKALKNSGKGHNSWLSGLTKCKYCGLAITVVNGQPNGKRYINCGGHKAGYCNSRTKHYTFDDIEYDVEAKLHKYLKGFKFVQMEKNDEYEQQIVAIQKEIAAKKNEVQNCLDAIKKSGNTKAREWLNESANKIDEELAELNLKRLELERNHSNPINTDIASTVLSEWYDMPLEEKKEIAHLFISKVVISNEEIEVIFIIKEQD